MTKRNDDAEIAKAQWLGTEFEKKNFHDISGQMARARQMAFLSGGTWVMSDASNTLNDAFQHLQNQQRTKTPEPPEVAPPQKTTASRGWPSFFAGKQQAPTEKAPKLTSEDDHKQTPGKKR